MSEFKKFHPFVNLIYFVCVIVFSMFLMHPVSLIITLLSAVLYTLVLKGKKTAVLSFAAVVPMMFAAALFNPLFNHRGVTIVAYLPGDIPLTMEAVYYGIAASVMIAAVIFHFNCYNEVMTSDKFIYLFGKIIPTLSLLISMTMRFVPGFISKLRDTVNVQKSLGNDILKGGITKRMKCAAKIFSILITWSLESAVETADSMKSRGYGLPGRTAYSIFYFEKRDLKALLWIVAMAGIVIYGIKSGNLYYSYYPMFKINEVSFFSVMIHIAYAFMCLTPVFIEVMEAYRWKATK